MLIFVLHKISLAQFFSFNWKFLHCIFCSRRDKKIHIVDLIPNTKNKLWYNFYCFVKGYYQGPSSSSVMFMFFSELYYSANSGLLFCLQAAALCCCCLIDECCCCYPSIIFISLLCPYGNTIMFSTFSSSSSWIIWNNPNINLKMLLDVSLYIYF